MSGLYHILLSNNSGESIHVPIIQYWNRAWSDKEISDSNKFLLQLKKNNASDLQCEIYLIFSFYLIQFFLKLLINKIYSYRLITAILAAQKQPLFKILVYWFQNFP